MPRRYDSEDAKSRILSATATLFIEKGYHNTTVSDICARSGIANGSLFHAFGSKEGILFELAKTIFNNKFTTFRDLIAANIPPLDAYAMIIAIQLALTEINEHLREAYIEVYTSPKMLEYINRRTAADLVEIFKEYLPDCNETDFFEIETGKSGMMRSFMRIPSDECFTLEKKIRLTLEMSLRIYKVPEEEQEKVIEYILGLDIIDIAHKVLENIFEELKVEYLA